MFHQVAVYDQGVRPGDIGGSASVDLTAPDGTIIIPNFLFDDAHRRLALSGFSFASMAWASARSRR